MIAFRIFGCVFQIHFLFLAALGCLLFTGAGGAALAAAGAVLLHEGGHLLVMAACRLPPERVEFQPFGVLIYQPAGCGSSYLREGLIALGGPVCSMAAAAVSPAAKAWLGLPAERFFLLNAALGLFNGLPIESLDGGRALYSFLCCKLPPEKAEAAVTAVSFCCLVPMAVLGFLFLLESKYNFTLLLASVYLMLCLVLKNRRMLRKAA